MQRYKSPLYKTPNAFKFLRNKPTLILQSSKPGPEIKSVDFPVHASSPQVDIISTTATFDLLNAITEGPSFYNRIGRRVHMKSVNVQGELHPNGQGAGVNEYLRVMLIYDRQPNGATPSIADILLDYDPAGATTTTSYSRLNPNNWDRFVMLRDSKINIPLNTNAGATTIGDAAVINYTTQSNFNWHVKLKDLESHYKSSSNPAVIGDISTGALWLVTFGSVASANAGYTLAYTARLRYLDI